MAKDMLATIALLVSAAFAENNAFGKVPVMGYNTYNAVWCSPNETHVRDTITAMHNNGFIELGYKNMMIDCGWFSTSRQANGSITYDTTAFPNGIAPLSQYAISKGMQWGMYTGASTIQCMPQGDQWPGSQYHEMDDALQFAGWNTVYVKADNCGGPDDTLIERYTNMSKALNAVGIQGFETCEWGLPAYGPSGSSSAVGPSVWTKPLATSYRIGADIAAIFTNADYVNDIFRLTNEAIPIIRNGQWGPGNFGDMDLLEVGNPGLTQTQQATHFAIWAMFKSPLVISTDIMNMTDATHSILSNTRLIAINQDPLGAPVSLLQRYTAYDIYSGPLANGDIGVLLVDQSGNGGTLSLDLSRLNVSSANITNLWTGNNAKHSGSYSATVQPYGSLPLRLTNIAKKATSSTPKYNYIEGSTGQLANGASLQPCTSCASGQLVGYIGGGQSNGGGSVTFTNITTSHATQNIQVDFTNSEIHYPGDSGINARGAQISVNGGNAVDILFPLSGYSWSSSPLTNFFIELTGFSTTGSNTITITGIPGGVPDTSNYGPNIVGIHYQT